MIILTLKTDNPEAAIGLYEDNKQIAYETWQAHRKLAETIHTKISELLTSQNLSLENVEGILVFRGPGIFTGLRIGVSVANALAYSLGVPIAAMQSDDWISSGVKRLLAGQSDKIALPEYGAPVHTTAPRK